MSVILAAIFAVDPALFSGVHVPYWAYGAKFFAILFAVRVLSQLTVDAGDRKRMMIFTLLAAAFIILFVVAVVLA
ncbi:hypothetical protein [Corynebacterium doosanense]|uniref:Uncharacterized protein n=1 Tax=Corynebacterium doosanense CAU 212 = DSM 45436 TaxID=558173 RepID=A0A097IJJ4_9CORY|nr:hypothetical protein [Corynebacterium doosanense]AIT62285.1 hypothetical protein CDOO_08040 [Corynebacterium doosanense CAU 212 = DSM 45436]